MGGGLLNWKSLGGFLFALGALIWVFHDVELSAITSMAGSVAGWWLVPAVGCDVLSYLSQGIRWRLLLRPVGNLPLQKAVQAIYAGLFTNEVIPLRFGEVVRAYLAARALRQPLTSLIPSIAVERLIDSVWLATGCGVMLLFVPLPREIDRAAEVFGGVIAALAALFVFLVLKPPAFLQRWTENRNSRLRSVVGGLLAGITNVGLNRRLAGAVAYSLALVLLQAAAFWFVMIACRLPLGYGAAAAVFLIVHLGTALPNAPANVAAFQFFTVLALQLFGVDKATAASFSAIVFVVLTAPLWALGFAAVSTTGITLAEIRREELRRGRLTRRSGLRHRESIERRRTDALQDHGCFRLRLWACAGCSDAGVEPGPHPRCRAGRVAYSGPFAPAKRIRVVSAWRWRMAWCCEGHRSSDGRLRL